MKPFISAVASSYISSIDSCFIIAVTDVVGGLRKDDKCLLRDAVVAHETVRPKSVKNFSPHDYLTRVISVTRRKGTHRMDGVTLDDTTLPTQ